MILGFKKKVGDKPTNFKEKILSFSKKHTIREDKHDRWKQGRMIQFAYGVRTKQFEKFAEMPCLGIQKIRIVISGFAPVFNQIYVDGKEIVGYKLLNEFAKNDGFDSIEDFFKWFNKDFEGKIIHWTNHVRY